MYPKRREAGVRGGCKSQPSAIFILETRSCKNLPGALTPVQAPEDCPPGRAIFTQAMGKLADMSHVAHGNVMSYKGLVIRKSHLDGPSSLSSSSFPNRKTSGICSPLPRFRLYLENKPTSPGRDDLLLPRNQGCPSQGAA